MDFVDGSTIREIASQKKQKSSFFAITAIQKKYMPGEEL